MLNLAALRTEARAIAQRQSDRLGAAIGENRELSAEEETADKEDGEKLARLTKQIEQAQRVNDTLTALNGTTAHTPAATRGSVPASAKPALDNGGFAHMAEFAQAVRLANPGAGQAFKIDDRLAAPTNVHMETGDSAGSYLVPPEYRQQIVDLVFGDTDPVLDLFDPSPTASNTVVGIGDESTPWGTSGVQAHWRVEAEQMSPSRLSLAPRETKLHELYAFVLATEELLEDAPRTADLLTNKAAAAIRWKASDAIIWADGISKPLGYMSSDALITVAEEGAQDADTVVRQNIAKMWARMINPQQAVWLANGDVLPQLMELTTDNGVPLWYPNYQVSPGGMLLGRPVVFTEHAQSLGDVGDLTFVNPNGYEAFRKQNGVSFADSIHLYFDYNIRAFRWIFRIGGQPVLSAPVQPAHGNSTKSHFVALAERA